MTDPQDEHATEQGSALLNIAILGASAGGVDALSKLIERIPADPAFATVVLTHLDPNHESQLATVLQKKTTRPVRAIEHGASLAHGHVYVLPQGRVATLRDSRFVLAPRPEGPNLPIDAFMLSAARDDDLSLAAVVLSGTGNDGTAGATAIRQSGGFVIAQDPDSARHDGMPLALIDENAADEVLPPEAIGEALQRYFAPSGPSTPGSEAELIAEALNLIHGQFGLDLRYYKDVNVRRRLLRRAFLQARGDLGAYIATLRRDHEELATFRDDLLIGVTAFFRDSDFIAALEQHVFPDVLDRNSETIRVWVPACSTGEEAYSIAILLHHTLQIAGITRKVQVFGSDVNERAIAHARSGRYSAAAVAAVPDFLRSRYFTTDENGLRVIKQVREMCVFAAHNVFTNAPFSNVDLVSVRNFLIYLRKTAKRQAFEVFFYALRRGGHLLLGPSENADPELFEENQPALNLYRRRQISRPPIRGFSFAELSSASIPGHQDMAASSLESMVDRLALARYAPPGFVVDANGRVVQFRGDTSPFLQPTSGDAALSLAKLVRPELQVDVRAALMEAVRSKLPVRRERVRLGEQFCALEVVPVPASGTDRYFLVSVQNCAPDVPAALPNASSDSRTEDLERYVRVLGDELEQTRAQLKAVVTEYDTTSEELRTANEEILSANEELQSANEDLKEAKRDLETVNTDLSAANDELQQRNTQLVGLNDDLNNLIRGIPVPVLMLDREQYVRHFSPAAAQLFDLSDDDAGKPLALSNAFPDDVLANALNEALQELRPVEREVRDRSGRWYVLWTRAYQTSDNRIEGAVLAFQDIHRLKLALETANHARAEAERANVAKNEFLALVSHELRAPLNVISNWVQLLTMLGATAAPGAKLTEGLQAIDRGVKNQSRLIDDLLDVSRITSGKLVLDLRPTDLSAVLRSTVEGMTPLAAKKSLTVTLSGAGEPLVLAGDTRRLQQIISNILANAIKFTPEGGHISVALARVDSFAELSITDTGIGIEPDELPRIFERFTQGDISKTRRYEGLGLGLSIVQSLTEAHGGTVAAFSAGTGQGTRLLVRLPLAPATLEVSGDGNSVASPTRSLHGLSVLVVDDEPSGRDALMQMLSEIGAEVEIASGAAEALETLARRRFSVLVADIAMPGMDGYDLIRNVRQSNGENATIYAIALTGFTSLGERDEALAAGYDAHIGKPVSIDELTAAIIAGTHARAAR